jgi:H+/Cl- antiporter ClcA
MNEKLARIGKSFFEYGVPPLLALVLKFIPYFDLTPLSFWDFPTWAMAMLGALVGAYGAAYWPYKNIKRWKQLLWVLPFVALLGFLVYLYSEILTKHPPTPNNETSYSIWAFVVWWPSYITFGFVTSNVFRTLMTDNRTKPRAAPSRSNNEI